MMSFTYFQLAMMVAGWFGLGMLAGYRLRAKSGSAS